MVSWVQRGGPLAEFADGYRDEFTCGGFTANSVVTHVVLMGQLSRWINEVRVAVGVLTPAWIEEFLDSRRAQTAHVGHQWLGRYGKTDSAWSPSPRCGPTSGSITRYMRCRILRPGTSRRGRAIRVSAPSWRSARIWRSGPGLRGSCSVRWPPTAPTGTRTGSAASSRKRGCRL